MGAPPGKFRSIGPDWERYYARFIELAPVDELSLAAYVEAESRKRCIGLSGHALQSMLSWCNELHMSAIRAGCISQIVEKMFPPVDQPRLRVHDVNAFGMGRVTISNAEFALFCSAKDRVLKEDLGRYHRASPTPRHPACFVSWFEAVCFARWCRWKGRGCRLPYEYEWEYVAKLEIDWTKAYWWNSDDWDESKGTATVKPGSEGPMSSTIPSPAHASPETKRLDTEYGTGVQELLGNIWEWCMDEFHEQYERSNQEIAGTPLIRRTLRGGSWRNYPEDCRSSYRYWGHAAATFHNVGLRLVREPD